jgi:DNA-directed RNA polymerase specialized sigma24 family protein
MQFNDLCAEIDALYQTGGPQEALFTAIRRLALLRLRGNEDAAQDVVVAAWQALPSYDPKRPFSYFVNAIITNDIHDAFRRENAAMKCDQLTDAMEYAVQPDFEFADTSSIDDPFIQVVAEMMQRGYTLAEIAAMSEMTPDAVRQRVFRYKRSHEIPNMLKKAA